MARASSDPLVLVALVPEGGSFEGLVASREDSRLDGVVEGEVLVGGRVEVGENAQVRARIEAEKIVVAGRVEGDLRARRSVELGPRAVVEGNLTTPRLATADGSRFDGRLEMSTRLGHEDSPDSPQNP
jgi:cytoskeletal protein CcmA (bactofilin family)